MDTVSAPPGADRLAPRPAAAPSPGSRRAAVAPTIRRSRPARVPAVLLACLMLLTAGLVNGRPAIFTDSVWYYAQGEYLAARLGLRPANAGPARAADPTSVMPDSDAMRGRLPATIAGGRSPFYGLGLFLSVAAGSVWLLVVIQALVSAWVVRVVLRAAVPTATPAFSGAVVLALSLATSLPYFVAFAMPDLFVGLAIPCVALVLVLERLSRSERGGLWILLTACLAVHTANLALAGVLSLAVLAASVVLGQLPRVVARRAAWLATAFLAAGLSAAAFAAFYERDAGVPQRSPPFLMARLLADGPGRAYLATACPGGASPTLCGFADRPLADVEEILFSNDPRRGVFSVSDYDVRTRLKDEEPAFVLAVVRQAPLATLRAALGNGLLQLGDFAVVEPLASPARWLRSPWWRRTAILDLAPSIRACAADPEPCDPRIGPGPLAVLHMAVVLAALCRLAMAAVRIARTGALAAERREGRDDLRTLLALVAVVALGVVANAGICGAAVGAFPRFQARVIWLVPLMALLVDRRLRDLPPAGGSG